MQLNWKQIKVPSKQTATYTWSASHAALVHEGTSSKLGNDLPARPWVNHAIDNTDIPGIYADEFQKTEDFESAFTEMATQFGEETQKAIDAVIWDWPRTTQRKNGDVVGSPRDIVDTGALKNSYSMQL